MHEFAILWDLFILIAFAIPMVALAQRLKLPSIAAFLLTGIAIGPHGFGLISRSAEVATLAEIGVVLLLFEIGLEVSLAQIVRLRSTIALGGTLQIGITIGAAGAVAGVAGLPVEQAVALGCFVALSSTAIVLKSYRDRGELDAPHGRTALGILLAQDLMVVPLMLAVQLLGSNQDSGGLGGIARAGLGLLVLVAIMLIGRKLVPWVLERVADFQDTDLFTLAISFFGLGAALVAASVGLSLALGAFLAGLLISESEYGAQALSDVLPFRALFSSIFFTSVGMLLDLGFVAEHLPLVGGAAVGVIVGKAIIVGAVVTLALRQSFFTGMMSGLGLAQIGEFSFALAIVAAGVGLVPDPVYQVFLAATVVSMLATPLLIAGARPAAEWLGQVTGRAAWEAGLVETQPPTLKDHAIIVGYGMTGSRLARVFKAAHIPYIVLETNGLTVRAARQDGESIAYGDGTRREVLVKAGIVGARVAVFNIASPIDELRGVSVARELNPSMKIVVRTRTVDAIADLERRGASDVVVEEYEAALELFQRVLRHYRIPVYTIGAELDAMRAEHYGILRGVPKEALHLDDLRYLGIHHALEVVEVEAGSAAIGKNPVTLDLRSKTGATVVAVIRKGEPFYTIDAKSRFEVGDAVVLVGPAPALVKGCAVFRAPPRSSTPGGQAHRRTGGP
jgi:CPA2 family monovalent cation:H+ antiporter-2